MMKLVKASIVIGVIGGIALGAFGIHNAKKNAKRMEEEFNRKDEVKEDGDEA